MQKRVEGESAAPPKPQPDEHWKYRMEKVLPMIPELVKVARENGYALLVHGSLKRDIDLVACPWTDQAVSAEEVAEAIRVKAAECNNAGCAFIAPHEIAEFPRKMPHGRLCWTFHLGGGPYLDLSVMAREGR